MKELSFVEKMAKKSFESPKFQQSWAVHMGAFGPILEPAFSGSYQAKVHLTAALNLISTRQFGPGLDKLKQVKKYCETDADRTAILFFMGVCFEMMGDTDNTLAFYRAANDFGHSFYMPYVKAGKLLLSEHEYEEAYSNYLAATRCFTATGLSGQDRLILGSAYTNLATCLIMLHRYDEAENALGTSRDLCPDAPGRGAIEAMLLALKGEQDALDQCLKELKEKLPEAYEGIKESTDRIVSGTDPLFFPQPVEQETVSAFWDWFASYSDELLNLLEQKKFEAALQPVADRLLTAFPFLEEPPYIALGKNEEGYVLELRDLYAVGIAHAYEVLMASCPDRVKKNWQFAVRH